MDPTAGPTIIRMSPQPEPLTQEALAGLVERVTYHNAENGFCVLRARARGHRDVVTVVGHVATISAGEWITASGEWVNDRTHGQQFKARFLRTSPPTSADGIEKYLSSGMIRGVGPVYAKKLVRAFGEKVFDVIEATPGRLREVDGIGPVRAASILAAWVEQKAVREIMVFLHSHGVGTARAVRIFKTYGSDAIQVMTENPYRLARDIRGIGFKTADAIAMKLGIEKTAMIRVRAGISYALTEAMDEGHCGLPTDELVPLVEKLLEVPQQLIRTALDLEVQEGTVIADRVGETPCVFLAGLHRAERRAFQLLSVKKRHRACDPSEIKEAAYRRRPLMSCKAHNLVASNTIRTAAICSAVHSPVDARTLPGVNGRPILASANSVILTTLCLGTD
jgi:exodeoxyribonuclease V alpha subunit